MTRSTAHPLLGVALAPARLEQYRAWVLATQRDLEIQLFTDVSVLNGNRQPLTQHLQRLLDGYHGRLSIHGPVHDVSLVSSDERIRALTVERLLTILDIGTTIGADQMVIHSPFVCFGHPRRPTVPYFRRLDDIIDRIHLTLEPVIRQATAAQCLLVIKNIQDPDPSALLTLVRSFESPWVQMSLDVGHAFLAYQIGGPPPEQWVRQAGSLLAHVHLNDSDGTADQHRIPGQGAIAWRQVFAAIGDLPQQPRLMLKVHDRYDVLHAADWLVSQEWAN